MRTRCISLKFAGACDRCGGPLTKGERAFFTPGAGRGRYKCAGTVRCPSCHTGPVWVGSPTNGQWRETPNAAQIAERVSAELEETG